MYSTGFGGFGLIVAVTPVRYRTYQFHEWRHGELRRPGYERASGIVETPLGTKQMKGLTVVGRRFTATVLSATKENGGTVEIVDEVWESPELRLVIASRTSDPRFRHARRPGHEDSTHRASRAPLRGARRLSGTAKGQRPELPVPLRTTQRHSSRPPSWRPLTAALRSTRATNPAEQRRAQRLLHIQPLCARRPLDVLPQRLRKAHRPDTRRTPLPAGWPSAPHHHGIGRQFRHLPQRTQRRAAGLTRAGKRPPTHRREPGEVHRTIERISRFRSALFHGWSPVGR